MYNGCKKSYIYIVIYIIDVKQIINMSLDIIENCSWKKIDIFQFHENKKYIKNFTWIKNIFFKIL